MCPTPALCKCMQSSMLPVLLQHIRRQAPGIMLTISSACEHVCPEQEVALLHGTTGSGMYVAV